MTPAGDCGGLRAFFPALVAMTLVTGSESRAAAPASATHVRQLEYRLGIAGGTPNLQAALDVGAALDRRSPRWILGMGLGLLRGRARASRQDVWGIAWDLHARRLFPPIGVRPYVETGLGVYLFDVEPLPDPDAQESFASPGISLGAGLELRVSADNSIRLGSAVHFTRIGEEPKRHYQAGLGFAFHPPGR